MDEIKKVTSNQINSIVGKTGFDRDLILKDYYLTLFLYLMRDLNGIYFKGGTALQKTLLEYSRISEDIDFTLTRDVAEVKREIRELLEAEGFVLTEEKSVHQFTRLIVTYDDELGKGTVLIDLNERGKLLTSPVVQPMSNLTQFYLTQTFSKQSRIPLAMRTIQKYIKDVAERARIRKPVSPHILRHTFAVTYIHKGGNLRALQAILGHSSITTTDIYLNYSGIRVCEDFQKIW